MGLIDKVKYINANLIVDINTEAVTADEDFYNLVGNEADTFIFSKYIHPDDLEKLNNAIYEADAGKKALAELKFNVVDLGYRLMLVTVESEGEDIIRGRLYKINIKDVLSLVEQNEGLREVLNRYSEIMSLTENVMFYYKQESNVIKIFMVSDMDQTLHFYSGNLDEWYEMQVENNNLSKKEIEELKSFRKDLKQGKKSFTKELKLGIKKDNSNVEKCFVKAITVEDYENRKTTVGIISVVSGNKEVVERQASFVSDMKDAGTDLLNKRAVTEYVRNLIESKPDTTITIAVIDIDDFKMVNDTYGHMFGDEVLNNVAGILKEAVGSRGICGRIGGDEMFIMVEGLQANEEVRNILRPIRNNIAWLYHDDSRNIKITCSIGCACYPKDADNYDELFNIADKMLYLAKEKGKNRYIIYQDDLHYQYVYGTGKIVQTDDKAYYKYKKLDSVNYFITEYGQASEQRRKELLDIIMIAFDLDTISLYDRVNKEKIQIYGKESFHKEDIRFFDDDNYIKSFRDDGIQAIDNIDYFEMKVPKLYEFYSHIGIKQAVQFIVRNENKENANIIISFNRFRQEQKWAMMDLSYLAIVGNIIGINYINDK